MSRERSNTPHYEGQILEVNTFLECSSVGYSCIRRNHVPRCIEAEEGVLPTNRSATTQDTIHRVIDVASVAPSRPLFIPRTTEGFLCDASSTPFGGYG